jgi:uncharacterized protein YndB with AHSA1/START domain
MQPNPSPDAGDAADAADDLSVVFVRVVDVPVRFVWLAWSKPEHVLQWFGPEPYPLALCEMDFRQGGRFRFAMKDPKGTLMTAFGGEFLELALNERVRYSNTAEAPGAETMIVTWDFAEKDGKTTITHHTQFPSRKMRDETMARGYEKGANLAFDQYVNVIRRLAS